MTIQPPIGTALLFSEMTPPSGSEGAFNDWYDRDHIPVRMSCPGFVSAQRYRANDRGGYLAVYEIAEPGALSTPEYQDVKENPSELTRQMLARVSGFTRYLAQGVSTKLQGGTDTSEALDARILYAVWFDVPPAAQAEFDDWYESEHVPLLLECREWLMVRRLRVLDGTPKTYTHLALHYLDDENALESPAREAARNTEWRARLAASDWFNPIYSVFRRHGERHLANH